jgi:hypothetical protein
MVGLPLRSHVRGFVFATSLLATAAGLQAGPAVAMTRVTNSPDGIGRPGDALGQPLRLLGDTLAVAAPHSVIVPYATTGVVEIYRHQVSGWESEATLKPDLVANDEGFGTFTLLGQDIVVTTCHCGVDQYVYTFERSGSTWSQTNRFPTSFSGMALSGTTLAVTTPNTADIYIHSGANWVPQANLALQLPAYATTHGVAIDGDIAVVLHSQGTSITRESYASFFSRSGVAWTLHETFDLGMYSPFFPGPLAASVSGETAIIDSIDLGQLGTPETVRVFNRNAGVWSQQGVLDPGAPFTANGAVAMDGDLAVVGSSADTVLGQTSGGTAYVFARSDGVWSRVDHLYDPAVDDNYAFAAAVAISGTRIAVGSPGAYAAAGGQTGKAILFEPNTGTWHIVANLDHGNAQANEAIGRGSALSGTTLLAGAPDAVGSNPAAAGAAYVFEKLAGVWTQQVKLAPTSPQTQGFGTSMALQGDTAAVGAPYDNTDGAAYVYTRASGDWPLQQKLTGAGASEYFGQAVMLDGNTLAAGAPVDITGSRPGAPPGAVYLFSRSGTTWSPQAVVQPSDGSADDEFGFAVGLSGGALLVGSPRADVGIETDAGAAYVFVYNGTSWVPQAKLLAPSIASSAGFGVSVALRGDTAVVGAGKEDPRSSPRGAAYVYRRTGNTWAWQATLAPVIAGPIPGSYGNMVALSDSGNTLLVGAPFALGANGTTQGAAYVFLNDGTSWQPASVLGASSQTLPYPGATFGISAGFSGDDAVIGSPTDGASGAVYVTSVGDHLFADGFETP